jgi:hypothetical protein
MGGTERMWVGRNAVGRSIGTNDGGKRAELQIAT